MANVFVPLNRFQSVVTNLTGEEDQIYTTPQGVSTIVLSAQITNNSLVNQPVTIFVTSNAELPVPNFETIWNGSNFISASLSLANYSGSFASASSLLSLNRQFIRKEAAAYINFLNNQNEIPFSFTSSRFEGYALDAVDATAYDIKNKTVIRTTKDAKSFYTKNGVNIIKTIYPEEYSSSLFTLDYVKTLAGQVIKNQSVTGSTSIQRLYQTAVTQSFNSNYAVSGQNYSSSIYVIDGLINVTKATIDDPTLVAQNPVQLVTNVIIPPADSLSPVVAGKLVLEETYGFVVSGSTDLTVILSLLESANE
jgi:hypothetical protein